MGYCFENNRLYCFPNPRWRLEKSDQSGDELRIQDGGSGSETWNEAPGFHRSLFWGEKRPEIGLSDSSDMSIENQSRHM